MQKKEEVMPAQDTWCTVGAYFKVKPGKLEEFEQLADRFVEKTCKERGIRHYGWSFNGEEVHCRQGYLDAEGLLEHAENVGTLFQEALTIADCTRLAIHGPEEELAKVREPLAGFGLQCFVLKNSFRR
jgi:quinol monooxygenase YgiN